MKKAHREFTNQVTPFKGMQNLNNPESNFTTPQKERSSEHVEPPRQCDVRPEQPPQYAISVSAAVTPTKRSQPTRQDTSPRSSNISRDCRKSKDSQVRLQKIYVSEEKKYRELRPDRGNNFKSYHAQETEQSPKAPSIENGAQGNSYDDRNEEKELEQTKSLPFLSQALDKSNTINSTSPFCTYGSTLDTRLDRPSNFPTHDQQRSLTKKYKGQEPPIDTESSLPYNSDLNYSQIDSSSSSSKSITESKYDSDAFPTEQWVNDYQIHSSASRQDYSKGSYDMKTIREVSDENMSESTFRITGPQYLMKSHQTCPSKPKVSF